MYDFKVNPNVELEGWLIDFQGEESKKTEILVTGPKKKPQNRFPLAKLSTLATVWNGKDLKMPT